MDTSPAALLTALARGAGRALVLLWWWGPRPEQVPPGTAPASRSRTWRTYRGAWRAGRVLGWAWGLSVAAVLVGLLVGVLVTGG
ncbi:hypothetical protein MO973_41930 [Paenibacillus sp. TRM 82003]|uniref:hypothetical protein n=1 Tax=Kineococcus sp. TRM81007 TaxID=2925831 RepID=UPI001F568525|nr:hypothetical protein [Kineococcus sp. TRM81007]MCI2239683.1 hypothetical protein [Kineococcus sp. TRM81007]MCI3926754.1 hypothetical protein [Paenibacillus sp. TRM 82003]